MRFRAYGRVKPTILKFERVFMNQPKTVDRGVALIKFALDLLRNQADGMRPRDIYAEIESKLPLMILTRKS